MLQPVFLSGKVHSDVVVLAPVTVTEVATDVMYEFS